MEFHAEVQNRWLASIVSGALAIAAGFSIPVFGLMFGGPAVLMAAFSGLGVLTGVLSLAAKEKRKHPAYVGIALSAAPWILGLVLMVIHDSPS